MTLSKKEQAAELYRCALDPHHFTRYLYVKPDSAPEYQPLRLWPAQERVLDGLATHKYSILLKARQLGITQVTVAHALHVGRFEPNSLIFLLSKQKDDAVKLLEKIRLMWQKLPEWMRPVITRDNHDHLAFANGSAFLCFASNKSQCDGLTGRLAVIDEADLIGNNLGAVLNGVIPAIAAGGQLVLLSKANKDAPESKFKQIFRSAVKGQNDYWPLFLPWWSRPDRTRAFYDAECRNSDSVDYVWENYPASVEEALAPRQEAKRLPLKWLEACCPPMGADGLRSWPLVVPSPALAGVPGLRLFESPQEGHEYVIGVDLASGKGDNPNLDDSAAVILDRQSKKQVGLLVGKLEPELFASYVAAVARHYHSAGVLVERNGQYGGSAITYLKHQCPDVNLLRGPDGDIGFHTTAASKVDLYNRLAEKLRCSDVGITDSQTFEQLASIEGRTLEAPPGLHDDIAMAAAIAVWASEQLAPVFDIQFADLETSTTAPQPGSPGEGIIYLEARGEWSVSVPSQIPGKHKGRVNVGNYFSVEHARYAHRFASTVLGQTSPYEVVLPDAERDTVERVVRQKLEGARR